MRVRWRWCGAFTLSMFECSLASSCHKKAQEHKRSRSRYLCVLRFLWLRSKPAEGMDVARIPPSHARFFKLRTRLNPVILLQAALAAGSHRDFGLGNQMN